jgi:hypothetical protein
MLNEERKQKITTAINENDFNYLEFLFLYCEDEKIKLFALDKIFTVLGNYNHIKNILK